MRIDAKKFLFLSVLLMAVYACTPPPAEIPHARVPSLEFTRMIRTEESAGQRITTISPHQVAGFRSPERQAPQALPVSQVAQRAADERASIRFVKDYPSEAPAYGRGQDVVTNLGGGGSDGDYIEERSTQPNIRDYSGPLSLGDPGVSASLWRESRAGNDLFRDHRAHQPLDLLTIIISETSEGSKEADTETKRESTLLAGIASFFNFETDAEAKNPGLDTSTLIDATTTNDFKGEADTTRKGSLQARISAMVVEVLPSGVLRIEGEKIIAVNNEEQIIVISGLVRTRDINSNNEVESSKLANLRIDYYGKGIVGEAQYGGWFGRMLQVIWPF